MHAELWFIGAATSVKFDRGCRHACTDPRRDGRSYAFTTPGHQDALMIPLNTGRGEFGAPIIIQMTRATQSADSAHHFSSAISETPGAAGGVKQEPASDGTSTKANAQEATRADRSRSKRLEICIFDRRICKYRSRKPLRRRRFSVRHDWAGFTFSPVEKVKMPVPTRNKLPATAAPCRERKTNH